MPALMVFNKHILNLLHSLKLELYFDDICDKTLHTKLLYLYTKVRKNILNPVFKEVFPTKKKQELILENCADAGNLPSTLSLFLSIPPFFIFSISKSLNGLNLFER